MLEDALYWILWLAAGVFFLAAFSHKYRATGAIMATSFAINIALYNKLDALTAGDEIDHLIKAVLIVGLNYTTIVCLLISTYKFRGTTQITQSLILGAFILTQHLADSNIEGPIWQNFEYILLVLYLITGLSIYRGTINGARNITDRHRDGELLDSRTNIGSNLFSNNNTSSLATMERKKDTGNKNFNIQNYGMGKH